MTECLLLDIVDLVLVREADDSQSLLERMIVVVLVVSATIIFSFWT